MSFHHVVVLDSGQASLPIPKCRGRKERPSPYLKDQSKLRIKHKTTLYSWRPKNVGICCKLINAPKKQVQKRKNNWVGVGKQRQDEKNKHTKVKTKKQNAKKALVDCISGDEVTLSPIIE
jgi:hypothetical protein